MITSTRTSTPILKTQPKAILTSTQDLTKHSQLSSSNLTHIRIRGLTAIIFRLNLTLNKELTLTCERQRGVCRRTCHSLVLKIGGLTSVLLLAKTKTLCLSLVRQTTLKITFKRLVLSLSALNQSIGQLAMADYWAVQGRCSS